MNKTMDPVKNAFFSFQLFLLGFQQLRLVDRLAQYILIQRIPLVGRQKKIGGQ
jgi:hypothetical protein